MTDVFCDAIARLRFFSVDEGGLPALLDPSLDRLGCLLNVDGKLLDCMVLSSPTRPGPSVVGECPLVFLQPERAKPKLTLGSPIVLQQGSAFAQGEIIALPWMSDYVVKNRKDLDASVDILSKRLADDGHREEAKQLSEVLGADPGTRLKELRVRLLALREQGIVEERVLRWRVEGILKYLERQLNAWPSTAIR